MSYFNAEFPCKRFWIGSSLSQFLMPAFISSSQRGAVTLLCEMSSISRHSTCGGGKSGLRKELSCASLKELSPYFPVLKWLCSQLPDCAVYQPPRAIHMLISTILISWGASSTHCLPGVLQEAQEIATGKQSASSLSFLWLNILPRSSDCRCWARGRVARSS